jgi:hypothetical protein
MQAMQQQEKTAASYGMGRVPPGVSSRTVNEKGAAHYRADLGEAGPEKTQGLISKPAPGVIFLDRAGHIRY